MAYCIQINYPESRAPRLLGDCHGIKPVTFPDEDDARDYAKGLTYKEWLRGSELSYSVVPA